VILEGSAHWDPPEIVRQIRVTRRNAGADGNIHFSARAVTPADHGMGETIRRDVYDTPAVIPESAWIDVESPGSPRAVLVADPDGVRLEIEPTTGADVRVYAVNVMDGQGWGLELLPGESASMLVPEDARAVVVRAVGRTGRVSRPVVARPE
jgi:hypothetical protein